MSTIEQEVVDVADEKIVDINVNGKCYKFAPPTLRTMMHVSAVISKLPTKRQDVEAPVWEALACAEYVAPLQAEAVAIMILGAKPVRAKGLKNWWKRVTHPYRLWKLKEEIINNFNAKNMLALFKQLTFRLDTQDFFDLTTSLIEINLLKATREVV